MTLAHQESSLPFFEINHPETYRQFFLINPREILWHLTTLQKKHAFTTLYLDAGQVFFLSSIIAVDEANHRILLDTPRQSEQIQQALHARQITLSTSVDRIKIQCRLHGLSLIRADEQTFFSAEFPAQLLRLQRRDFFRIETPLHTPARCKLAKYDAAGHPRTFDFPQHDISGGGLCLTGDIEHAEHFIPGEVFKDCRLEIPGENVISVNLRIREASRLPMPNGTPRLRLGCEFTKLPGTHLALIERYIAWLERERKSKEGGPG